MSEWLNWYFSGFDYRLLSWMHALYEDTGGTITPLMKFVSLFGEKGIFPILLSVVLTLFKKTRKAGVASIIAAAVGALVCNVAIKPTVARPRPYTVYPFAEWWKAVGAVTEKDFSFPSGHVNIITSITVALFFSLKSKKVGWLMFSAPLIMCFSRMYLMVHYPSDVLFALATGAIAGIAAVLITKGIYARIDGNDNKFCNFIREASVVNLFSAKGKNTDKK